MEDDLTIAYMCGVEKGKDYMREAINKKDAALQACVAALKLASMYSFGMNKKDVNDIKAAITKAQEVLK